MFFSSPIGVWFGVWEMVKTLGISGLLEIRGVLFYGNFPGPISTGVDFGFSFAATRIQSVRRSHRVF